MIQKQSALYYLVLGLMGGVVVIALGGGLFGQTEPWILQWQHQSFSALCHQMPERSFWIDGQPMAVCSRCFGIYASFLGVWMTLPLIDFAKTKLRFFNKRSLQNPLSFSIPIQQDEKSMFSNKVASYKYREQGSLRPGGDDRLGFSGFCKTLNKKMLIATIIINLADVVGNMLDFWQNTLISRMVLGALIGSAAAALFSGSFFTTTINKAEDHYGRVTTSNVKQ